ncbi:MAG: molybdenum cofactor guanylyltransferase [Bacteroidales bacterium]|nr:molybdenum cofactor guanylyltransferase [Bacteroidales bacterium]
MNKQEITGIVLAGGKSTRMGTDKPLLVWNGKTLIENAISLLQPLCNKVAISSDNHAYSFTGCEIWPDILPRQAPIVGIYSCLKRASTEAIIVLSCDMPLVSASLLKMMAESANDFDIVVPAHSNGAIEPLCALYKHTVLNDLELFIDKNLSVIRFIERSKSLYLNIGSMPGQFPSNMFANINTPVDFDSLNNKIS